MTLRIGVVGYCQPERFDPEQAAKIVYDAYTRVESIYPAMQKKVVSGLVNRGVLAIAYREAAHRGWKTVGIACARSSENECFPVDEKIIVGANWGDESRTFLENIDLLIRIGGGKQSLKETEEFKKGGKPVLEYELPESNMEKSK